MVSSAAQIPRVHPTLVVQHVRSPLRVLPVTEHYGVASRAELAALATGYDIAAQID